MRASTEHDGQQATAARLVSHGKPPVNRRASYGKPPVNRRASYGKPPVNRRASYGKPSVNRRAQTRRRRSGQVHNGGRMCQMHASKFISMLERCLFKKPQHEYRPYENANSRITCLGTLFAKAICPRRTKAQAAQRSVPNALHALPQPQGRRKGPQPPRRRHVLQAAQPPAAAAAAAARAGLPAKAHLLPHS